MEIIYQGIVYTFLVYIFLILILNVNTLSSKKELKERVDFYYYFIVPCVNEEQVIQKTLQALLDLNPDCMIVPIDDGSNDGTLEIMKQFNENRCIIVERKLPNAQKGKGEALNAALDVCIKDAEKKGLNKNKVIIGVVDADGKLSKNSIFEINKSFSDNEVVAAQMRVKMYPIFKNVLQVVQDFEFFTVNNLAQVARSKTNSVGLSGNGQFFRLAPILQEIGANPWGNSLLDDYELTLKLMLRGLKITYISEAYTYQEALSSVARFIKQRSRWVQGNLDCLKYVPKVVQSTTLTPLQKLSIFYFLSQPFLNLIADLCIILFSVRFGRMLLEQWAIVQLGFSKYLVYFIVITILSLAWGIIFTAMYYKNLIEKEEPLPSLIQFIMLPFASSYMYILLFFSVVMAFWRQLSNQRTWIKTKRN